MTELPLFFSHESPDNILSLLPGHGVAMTGSPMMLPSQLSGLLPSFGQHPESGLVGASLCIEPDMSDLSPDLSQKRASPGCLPLPEGSTSVPVAITDDRPGHSQTAWILPVNKRVPSINTAIPETHEKTRVFPLPCEQDACVAWDYGGRIIVLDISEIILSAEPVTDETKTLTPWTVIPTVDQEGNIIYQWHDHDGHLHTISEWEFRRRLSMYFQSLLEFLYPEYFGSSLPAGGGWHQWQYWKVRRTGDRPENADQQPWQTCRTRRKSNNKKVRPVAVVQPVQHRPTRYQPRHQNGRPQPSPSGKATATATERTVANEIDQLLMEFELGYMQNIAKKHNKNYDGKKHGQYCVKIKKATETRRKPLTDNEKLTFVPFMRHLSKVVYSFNEISLSACIHSLTASQLLYPPRSVRTTNTDPDDGGKNIKQAQAALIKSLISRVQTLEMLKQGFGTQSISNQLWALEKLVANGLLPVNQDGLASQAVMALLPQVQPPPEPFISQHISSLLLSLAKLVANGLLPVNQDGLASQAVMALLPQVQRPPEPFNPLEISNLLSSLAKLVENGLLQLNQDGLASQAVMALLPQAQRSPKSFNPLEISSLLSSLAKLVENGLLSLDQDSLVSQAVMALLPQVQRPPEPFDNQGISNLLSSLAKLVENGLLQLNQDGLASQAVMALLPQVQSPPEPFNLSGNISSLLSSLSILVENGLLSLDQDGLTRKAVMALLRQVQSPPEPFNHQGISSLLLSLSKLVENGLLSLDHLTRKAVMALLRQVQSPPEPFNHQDISRLLRALAKLVGQGLQLNQDDLASQVVMTLLPQVQSHLDDFTSQEISDLLWALAILGDGVSLDAVIDLLGLMNISTVESWLEQEKALWALTVFLARGGKTSLLLPRMRTLYDALMAEKENRSDIRARIMRLSGVWLGENQQDLLPTHYETIISIPHQKLYGILKDSFSGHALEMEASVNGLPPVDLLFPDNRVVIEVQGGYHYVDKEKKLRNGSTILKVMTYGKLGYKVFEIPASDVEDKKTQEQLQRELRAYFSNEGNSANSSTESDPETAEEDSYFSAAEEL